MPAEKQSDLVKQIQIAWDDARDQMEKLKKEVQRAHDMANATLQAKFLNREKDIALRDFGEAVWNQMMKGKLQLPPSLTGAVKAMLEVEKRLQSHTAHINDLLAEGEEAAERMKKNSKNSVVTSKAKKR